MVTFLRREAKKFSKFGKRRKKLLTWRKPKGRDNKMREKLRGYAPSVSIGYGTGKQEEKFVVISNIKDFEKIGKDQIGFVGKVGKKKKIEILTKAKEMKIKLQNFNPASFLKKEEKKKKNVKKYVKAPEIKKTEVKEKTKDESKK